MKLKNLRVKDPAYTPEPRMELILDDKAAARAAAKARYEKQGVPLSPAVWDTRALTAGEIRDCLDFASAKLAAINAETTNWPGKVAAAFGLTSSAWRTLIKEKKFRFAISGEDMEIKTPSLEGRSRFSRPALKLLRRLILDGKPPSALLAAARAELSGNEDPGKGLVERDLKWLADLARVNDRWEGLHIPDQTMDALTERHTDAAGTTDAAAAISELIGAVNDPIVRHRLAFFSGRLDAFHARFGEPESVVLEFVREDFMGEKAKLELNRFNREREKLRREAREYADEHGMTGRASAFKYELAKAQGFRCLYTGHCFNQNKLEEYDIDHIVPRSGQNGPDAQVNYVLATQEANKQKADRTPYEWLRASGEWEAYEQRVLACATTLRRKKVRLLLQEDAAEQVQRYTALAETAWIAKLAQQVVCLRFGLNNGNDKEGKKRVRVISGGLTARVRRKYHLNDLLLREGEETGEKAKKNRQDDRHHALDAMVLAFIPQWARDDSKAGFFRFPTAIRNNPLPFFKRKIDDIFAIPVAHRKAALAETIYGARRDGLDKVIVQRVALVDLGMKTVGMNKKAYDTVTLRKQLKTVRSPFVRDAVERWLEYGAEDEKAWRDFCTTLVLPGSGTKVRRVWTDVGEGTEYKDMSKDRTGAYRKGLKEHKGQLVYRFLALDDTTPARIATEPVYVFESQTQAWDRVKGEGPAAVLIDFFQSGCLVRVTSEVFHRETPLEAGIFSLNSIMKNGYVKLTTREGLTYPDIPLYSLQELIRAGFTRSIGVS